HGHGGAAASGRGRIRAFRIHLPKLPGRHGVPGRDPAAARADSCEPRADVAAAGRRRAVSRGADHAFMARALRLAQRAAGTSAPNPAVGCVLVRDGRVVGEGFTQPPGGPHAEIVALRAAGADARGATAYVTLEPCDHTGRTGPCSAALIEAGIARVVCAVLDPNPVAGRGGDPPRAAGVDVGVRVLETEARA